jgi:hypothetical protein
LSRGATVTLINLDVVNDASRQLYTINTPADRWYRPSSMLFGPQR